MNYRPEGSLIHSEENIRYLQSEVTLREAYRFGKILEGRAIVCNSNHDLIIDLGCMKGVIPREEGAIGIRDGSVRDIALISRVNKTVCFLITGFDKDANGTTFALLSRLKAQKLCQKEYLSTLRCGDIIPAKVTHLEPFGCFVDIGCGIPSLIPIDCISVSRISHPADRFLQGQDVFAVVKSFSEDGKICLSHKELLGSWEENAKRFHSGETVPGIIRSVESYGIFVELTPNLTGLAELREGVRSGQFASVYIKNLIPEKMKIKLIIVDAFDDGETDFRYRYYKKEGHIDYWRYSPEGNEKQIETYF